MEWPMTQVMSMHLSICHRHYCWRPAAISMRSRPLQDRLDKELAGTRRTKRVADNITIALTSEELQSFYKVKNLLRSATSLALPDSDVTTGMYSDASVEGWSIIITMAKDWCKTTPAAANNMVSCIA
ncbi:hypothetical protein PHMEG_0006386 [Phytophthora megakarya]|uniref:Reverse transcriptase n=1 Tax=Phytophthora megakarya TaxID=4795 RepID=A0A225WNY9_9STRA|nr:hypothetical protein PHMEG_0006386 [Phytophthora megakarya]